MVLNSGHTLRFAIVGCGQHARQKFLHIDRFTKNIALKTVCDLSPDVLRQVAAERPDVTCTRELGDILGDREIDFVVVATEPVHHYEIACQCLARGKHLLVEKPVTATLDESYRLRDALSGVSPCLMVGHHRRFGAAENRIRDILNSGALGKPIGIQVTHNFNDNSRNAASGYLSLSRDNTSSVVYEYLSHEIDLLRFYFPGVQIRDIDARVEGIRHRGDTAAVQMVLDNGILVSYFLCSATTDQEIYRIFGDSGQVKFNRYRDTSPRFYSVQTLANRYKRLAVECLDSAKNIMMVKYAFKRNILQAYIAEIEYLGGCIARNEKPACSIDEGIFVMETLARIMA